MCDSSTEQGNARPTPTERTERTQHLIITSFKIADVSV